MRIILTVMVAFAAILPALALAVVLAIISSLPGRAQVDADRLAAEACSAEILPRAYAACVAFLADGRLLAMETRIATLSGSLSGVRPGSLATFEQDLNTLQRDWRDGMEAECREFAEGDAETLAFCRLDLTLAREETLNTLLTSALGGVAPSGTGTYRGPSEVDIFVPLRIPGFGQIGGATVTVPTGVD